MISWVPLAVLLAGSSRQRPDCGLSRVRLVCARQTWAPVPLQSHSWTRVPLVVPPPLTSRHLLSARSVPSVPTVHRWALVPLQSYSCTWVPLAVLLPGSSRQRPDCGLTRVPLVCGRHTWAPLPLQSHSWVSVSLPVPLNVTSRHLPSAWIDPSLATVHC